MKELKRNNRMIGIIGGVGPQATSALYEFVTLLAQEKYEARNNDDYPHVIIESIPIPDFISNTNAMPRALEMLSAATRRLEKSEVDRMCIASNTVHLLLPELKKVTSVPFISMIESVAETVQHQRFRNIGIVASSVTLHSTLYEDALSVREVELTLPTVSQRVVIDKIIRHVLAGSDNGKERAAYIEILHDLLRRGAEGIILACTELPLAINYEALGAKIINSDKVLAEALVDYYYEQSDESNTSNKSKISNRSNKFI